MLSSTRWWFFFAKHRLDWEGIGTPTQMPKPEGQHHLKKQKDTAAFPNFMKKSLHVDPTSEQLKQKVHKKIETSNNYTKSCDKKRFVLFNKVWGNNGPNEAEENGKINGKTPKSSKKDATIRNRGSAKKELVTKKKSGKVEDDVDNSSLALSEMVCCDNSVGLAGLNKDAAKRGFELMGESKRVVLEDRRRKLSILSC